MDFVLLVFLSALLVAPLHLLVEREIRRVVAAEDDRMRRIVRQPEQCDELGPVIGFFNGATIYGTVKHLGSVYDYDRIAPPRYDRVLGQHELFVNPGLVYVTRGRR